jgi:hypothetical protein
MKQSDLKQESNMTNLAKLTNWETTARSLHKATQLLGAIRMLLLERVPNYLELSTVIQPNGLSSGVLPFGGEILLDFQKAALIYENEGGKTTLLPLVGNNQATLLEKLLVAINADLPILPQTDGTGMSLTEALMIALKERAHPFLPRREDLTDETPFEIDPAFSGDYSQAIYQIFTATARFRARITGPMTPVVVWPEHFDLSFLWFATPQATDDQPHMNFGFAPYSAGLPRPYLYAYAYPMPEGFESLKLPALAHWNTEGWKGVVVAYDDLVKQSEPEKVIEDIFLKIYEVLSPTLTGKYLAHS